MCSQETQVTERKSRKEVKVLGLHSICGVKKGREEQNLDAEHKALKYVHN